MWCQSLVAAMCWHKVWGWPLLLQWLALAAAHWSHQAVRWRHWVWKGCGLTFWFCYWQAPFPQCLIDYTEIGPLFLETSGYSSALVCLVLLLFKSGLALFLFSLRTRAVDAGLAGGFHLCKWLYFVCIQWFFGVAVFIVANCGHTKFP